MDLISKHTRQAFREHLVGWTLRRISDLFDACDISRGQPSAITTGERRSLVEEYYAGVDWSSTREIRKMLRAYEEILTSLESDIGAGAYVGEQGRRELQKLTLLLKRDGYIYEHGRLSPVVGIDLKVVEDASNIVDRQSLREHIQRIEQSVEADPAQAIGSAKELIETVGRHILTHYGHDPDQYDSLQQLLKQAFKCLDLSIEKLPETKKGAESIRQVLSGLAQIVGGTAELRNLYGTGHGRTRSSGLEARHARLVVGATATLTAFLLETLGARQEKMPESR